VGNPTGFMQFPRVEIGHRPIGERVRDFGEIDLPLLPEEMNRQAARCMDCGIPYCHGAGCPVKNRIPEFNDLVYRNRGGRPRTTSTRRTISRNSPSGLPRAVRGGLHAGLQRPAVNIKHIEYQIVERGWAEGWIKPLRPP